MHKMLGSEEAAAIIGVDRATFNRWARKGEIPFAFKGLGVSGMRLFDPNDIERIAKARAEAQRLEKARYKARAKELAEARTAQARYKKAQQLPIPEPAKADVA